MRRSCSWLLVLGILILLAAALVYVAWPGKSTFTISPQTTYVTGPIDKYGYIDYVTALNERLGRGITPKNNAAILIWQALGPRPEGGNPMPAEYFRWLQIEAPSEQGDYLISWQGYLQERAKNSTGSDRDPAGERITRAVRWPWTARQEPELADWLKRNEKPLALFLEASRRTQYYNPIVPDRTEDWSPGLVGALLPNVQRCRDAANALACRAMLRLGDGKVDEAWQDLLACHRLGRLVGRGGTIIEWLVGLAIDQVADNADIAFVDHSRLTSKQVLACLDNLRKLPSLPAFADKIDLTERFMFLDGTFMAMRQGASALQLGPGSNDRAVKADSLRARLFTRNINWDPALRNGNRWLDRFVAALRIPDRRRRLEELAAIDRDLRLLKQRVTGAGIVGQLVMGPEERGETIGNILITLLVPALDKAQNAAERVEQAQRNLHVAFALVAYQRDQGHYPTKVEDLAPHYLAKVPDDLFSGKPLIYQAEGKGFLLYSVGPNGVDDGGHGVEDEPRGDDLPIHIPVPEPRKNE
jgi:hypothetical protein